MSKARCARCGDIIESLSVHDWRECKCGSIFIDGGNEYFRCGFKEPNDLEIWNEETKEFMKTVMGPVPKEHGTSALPIQNVAKDYGKNKIREKLSRKTLRRNKND